MRRGWEAFWEQLAPLVGFVSLAVVIVRGHWATAAAIALVLLLQLTGMWRAFWRRRTGSNRRPRA